MIIKVSKDCRIEGSDGMQFILQVRERITDRAVGGRVSDRAGELSDWKNKGYYGNLGQVMGAILKRVVLTGSQKVTLQQLKDHVDRVAAHLERACEGVVTARSAAEMEGQVDIEGLDELFSEAV